MAIAANNAFTAITNGGTGTVTAGSNVVGVVFWFGATGVVTSSSWNGAAMTQIGSDVTDGTWHVSAWVIANPSTGAVTETHSGSAPGGPYVGTFTGVHQTSPVDNSNASYGTTTGTTNVSITTASVVASGCWLVGGILVTDGLTSVGDDYTVKFGTGAAEQFAASSAGTVGTGARTGSWVRSIGTGRAAIGIALQPAAAAGGTSFTQRRMIAGIGQ